MPVRTGKIGGAGAGLITPGFWSASYSPIVITDPTFIRGLEATFTFNGLTLNDKTSADVYDLSKISGIYDADLRDSREARPAKHGEIAYESFYAGRTVILTGTIKAGNLAKLRNMISDLQYAFADMEDNYLIISYPNETETYLTGRKLAPLEIAEEFGNRRMEREFMISIRAEDPRFYSNPAETITITPTEKILRGRTYDKEFNIEYDDFPPLEQIIVNNHGTASNYPDIKFYGNILNFVLINYTTGEKVIINSEIPPNDYYYYNQTKSSLSDSNGNSVISALDISSTGLSLVPGDNLIGFGGETFDPDAKVEIYAKSSWI